MIKCKECGAIVRDCYQYAEGYLCPNCYITCFTLKEFGGDGSGHFGHSGRPGEVGGSMPEGEDSGGSTSGEDKSSFKGIPLNPQGKTSSEQYRSKDGKFTPERQELHKQILSKYEEKHFKGKTPVDNPISVVLGGGSASGKSTMLKSGQVTIPSNSVTIDNDEIKLLFPEYDSMVKAGKSAEAAAFVHDEASYLSKELLNRSSTSKFNTVFDGTGDGDIEKLKSRIAILRKSGQKVLGLYATVPVETAIVWSMERAKETKRYVPESVIRATHAGVSRIFPKAIEQGLFDDVMLYDTQERGKPKMIVSAKGTNLTIHDKAGYETFLKKGQV